MSRIGKLPIAIPSGVEIKLSEGMIQVKGPKGALTTPMHSQLSYQIENSTVIVTRIDDSRDARARHGLGRTLLNNCVVGVTAGFSKTLEVVGVGYKVALKGNILELNCGFSHPVLIELPKGIEGKVEGQKVILSGADKQLVGEIAASIRRVRKPEPYKGKGIRYENEHILRKTGKSGSKK
jgi:large subunit ribosomal protein L6